MQQLIGYYYTGEPDHFDGSVWLKPNHLIVANYSSLDSYMGQFEAPHPSIAKDGRTISPYWEYSPRDGVIYYRHRAIAIVDFETYDEPRLIEVRLINATQA